MQKQCDFTAETFPARLTALMKEHNCTQEDLAAAVGVRRQTISLYQTGKTKPDYVQIASMALYFGVSSDYLLGLSDYRSDRLSFATPEQLGLDEAAASVLAQPPMYESVPPDSFREMQNRFIASGDFAMLIDEMLKLQSVVERCKAVRKQQDGQNLKSALAQGRKFRAFAEMVNQQGEPFGISECNLVLPHDQPRYAALDAVEKIRRMVEDETGYNPREWETQEDAGEVL